MNINVKEVSINQVTRFRYLGSSVTEDAKCETEIKARIGMAKSNFGRMRALLTKLSINP